MSEQHFGISVESVSERDVDLLLLEEFHVSAEFLIWFCNRVGLNDVVFCGAWHSVSDADGESDLLLCVTADEEHVAVMIENKIDAPEQDRQDERYHLRGERLIEERGFDRYTTAICAPQLYLNSLESKSNYQSKISYEEIFDWLSKFDNSRAIWRRDIIHHAIQRARRGYVMRPNVEITSFHMEFWEYLQREHPRICSLMKRPTNKGSISNWIVFKGGSLPPHVHLDYKFGPVHIRKFGSAVVELGFDHRTVQDILQAKNDWSDDIKLDQKPTVAALVIKVPSVNPREEFTSQTNEVDTALNAVYRLLPYASLLS